MNLSRYVSYRRFMAAVLAGPYVSIVDQGIASASNFVPIVFLARFSAASELGIYSLIFTVCIFASGIEHALITAPYTFYCDDSADDAAYYRGSILIHHGGFLAGTSAVLLLAGIAMYYHGSAQRMPVMAAAVLAAGAVLNREFTRRVCFASTKVGLVVLLDICAALIQLTSFSLLAVSHTLTATSALYAVTGSTVPFIAYGLVVAPRVGYTSQNVISVLEKHWPFGKWIILSTSVSAIPQQIFPWCLALFYGPAAVGMLASCNGILQSANPCLIGFTNYFGPLAARVRRECGDDGLHGTLRKATVGLILFLALFCSMMFVFGAPLLTLVYGHRFAVAPNVHALWLLSLGVLACQSTLPLGLVFMALDRPRINVLGGVAGVCVAATIGVAAVRLIGIEGVGLGLFLAGCAESGVKVMSYSRWRELTPYTGRAVHAESGD
jgi:O-antigen/teichoic acid export membrane protein